MKGFAALCLLLAASLGHAFDDSRCRENVSGQFAYYKLAISRANEWCIANARPDDAQCGRDYVVHGLWPQCETGYPANCRLPDPRQQDRIDLAEVHKITPSDYLIRHEWEKHGSCTGLKRSQYFATAATLFNHLKLPVLKPGSYTPTELSALITAANPGMPKESVELACDEDASKPAARRDTLDEIRICFGRDGAFAKCRQVEQSCTRQGRIKVRG